MPRRQRKQPKVAKKLVTNVTSHVADQHGFIYYLTPTEMRQKKHYGIVHSIGRAALHNALTTNAKNVPTTRVAPDFVVSFNYALGETSIGCRTFTKAEFKKLRKWAGVA